MKRRPSISSESRHLRLLVLLLAAAVILPSVCLLWFMSRAVKNERLAVRQRLVDVYTRQAEQLAAELDEFYTRQGQDYLQIVQQHSLSEHFGDVHDKLALDEAANYPGLVVYNPGGEVIYPAPVADVILPPELPDAFYRAWELEYEKEDFLGAIRLYESLAAVTHGYVRVEALMATARCRRKLGEYDQAIKICRDVLADPNLTLTPASRALTVNVRILLLELLKAAESDDYEAELFKLRDLALNFNLPFDTRLFIWEKYKDLFSQANMVSTTSDSAKINVERQFEAELLSMTAAKQFADGSFFGDWTNNEIHALDMSGKKYAMFCRDGDLQFLILRPLVNFSLFENAFDDSSVGFRVLDDRAELVAAVNLGEQYDSEPAFLTIPGGKYFPDWQIEFYFQGDNIFAEAAAQQNTVYLWTAVLVLVLVIAAGLFAGRLVGMEIKLNRLKNNFIATVSHELKTPLASMRLLVDTLLEGRYQDQQQVQDYLQMMSRENERLSRLIDNFLTFSRMERNKQTFNITPIDPAKIAQAAVEVVKAKFEKRDCQLALHINDTLPRVKADLDAMVMVLVNLLDNGCKYSSDNNKKVGLKVYAEDGAVCFAVADNGVGIPKRAQKRIFDRFYQVDQSLSRHTEGAGLGLSIVKFIVDAHNGTIDVQSTVARGSTFMVKLAAGI